MSKTAVLLLLFLAALPLAAQEDPVQVVGLTLAAVYARYGIPESVHAVRGAEEWQDDVVFVYKDWDLYIYQDRVWQVGLKSAFGINLGDPSGVAFLILGEKVQSFDGYLLYSLPPRSWPLQLRLNLDGAGKVAAIYIYRSDF
ncbi:MAG: hypothetical protein LBK63_02175 [Treponema sp.]|nr:hypothetical protein [Treponema sp.]